MVGGIVSDNGVVGRRIFITAQEPLVSVIIAYYNGDKYIREAVESVWRQTHKAIEIIIVDDGSRSEAQHVLQTLPGVNIIRQTNRGVAAARNAGLKAASGQYVIYLDQDDRLLRAAVATHLHSARTSPGLGLTFGAIRFIDQDGTVSGPQYICSPRRNYFLSMLESSLIRCPAAAMLSREAVLAVGGLDPAVVPADDYDLYLRVAQKYPVVRHNHLVAEYRIHADNVSHGEPMMHTATKRVLEKFEQNNTLNGTERRHIRAAHVKFSLIYSSHRNTLRRWMLLYFRVRSLLQSSFPELLREKLR